MARPRKIDSPDEFTATEVRIAGNISEGNMKMLRRGCLFPEPMAPSDGKAGYGLYGRKSVDRASIAGGLVYGGVELVAAARLAKEIMHPEHFGGVTDNLEYAAHAEESPIPGEAWRGDQILTIVGRQYVFVDIYDPIRQWASETPVLTIYGWESGQTPLFVPNIDRVSDSFIGPGEDGWIPWQAEIDRVDNEARAARRRAVALLQINLSLACRNGLDAILARRAQRQRPQS